MSAITEALRAVTSNLTVDEGWESDKKQSTVLWRTDEDDEVCKHLNRFGAEAGVLSDPSTVR